MIEGWLADQLELIISEKPSPAKALAMAFLGACVGFGAIAAMHFWTGRYIASLTLITVMWITLYSGFAIGVSFAVFISLAADYFFLVPIGTVLSDAASFEHFIVITTMALIMTLVSAALRIAYHRTVQAQRDAERSRATMENVLGLVSHDVRNPLTAIRVMAQVLLRDPQIPAQVHPRLSLMLTSVKRADEMIQSLLDVSRLRTGRGLPLEFKACDLSLEVSVFGQELALVVGPRLVVELASGLPGQWGITGIRRAVENLVNNAVKYGDAQTPIRIQLEERDGQAWLAVNNQGREIPTADQTRLFDSFYRTERAERGSKEGWGLGLAVVKGVAEAHSGKVEIRSTAAEGTTFALLLPVRKVATAPSLQKAATFGSAEQALRAPVRSQAASSSESKGGPPVNSR